MLLRNLERSLKDGPGRSPDTSALENGALHGEHATRKRTKVAVLISGSGACAFMSSVITCAGGVQ